MGTELQQRLESTTLGQWQARQIVKAAAIMAFFVESTHEDKLRWKPAIDENSKTRSVLELVGECIYANRRAQHVFLGEPALPPPTEFDVFESAQDAVTQLKDSAADLADVVAKLNSEVLAREYTTHRGPMPGALVMQFPVRNMTYHMGQINMIQLLYGDAVFHTDGEFTSL
jgi:uncharacterized damage-inducible protein DinB